MTWEACCACWERVALGGGGEAAVACRPRGDFGGGGLLVAGADGSPATHDLVAVLGVESCYV